MHNVGFTFENLMDQRREGHSVIGKSDQITPGKVFRNLDLNQFYTFVQTTIASLWLLGKNQTSVTFTAHGVCEGRSVIQHAALTVEIDDGYLHIAPCRRKANCRFASFFLQLATSHIYFQQLFWLSWQSFHTKPD